MTYFSIRAVSKTYESEKALFPFSLELAKGELLSIVGESGSGKSTLLRIMAGLEVQDEGEVWLKENEILNPKQKLVSGYDEIKLIYQNFHLYPNSTVRENITRPLLKYDAAYRENRVTELMNLLGLVELADRFPRELSGGQQQKVAIAKAFGVEPDVLLLDEPFSNLDSIQTAKLITELKDLFKQLGTTVVLVTHDLNDALKLTDNLLILKKGKVVQKGSSQKLCQEPKSKYVARLFSIINRLPNQEYSYIRASDVKLRTSRGILAHVEDLRFLVHYNSLKVKIKESGQIWEVDDPQRRFQIGDRVYLSWDEQKLMILRN